MDNFNTAYENYCNRGKKLFFQLHKNEEELNKILLEIYGLQDELTPDVELKRYNYTKTRNRNNGR